MEQHEREKDRKKEQTNLIFKKLFKKIKNLTNPKEHLLEVKGQGLRRRGREVSNPSRSNTMGVLGKNILVT